MRDVRKPKHRSISLPEWMWGHLEEMVRQTPASTSLSRMVQESLLRLPEFAEAAEKVIQQANGNGDSDGTGNGADADT